MRLATEINQKPIHMNGLFLYINVLCMLRCTIKCLRLALAMETKARNLQNVMEQMRTWSGQRGAVGKRLQSHFVCNIED